MPTTAPQWSLADIQLLPPMSNAFHMSAYKVAMSNNKEMNSLFQRSLIGMDAIYQVEFHDQDLGLRLENHISGRVVVHSVKPHARSGNNTNVEQISPGDYLVSIGCIALIPGSTLIQDVVELLCLQNRPIQLTFESHVALDLKQQMDTIMSRLEFNANTAFN
ncbi:hypothetical protein LEN26_007595 [Aphanomyces euteiches]|nr:hypothetical protein AeMF1_013279 [Aphanomyces euteiches]KAH9131760.1 hypothetical protein LEN26_007595 [Aphanomyces euteiches]KAH9166862.1 hypothetical protein AeNC1_018239 [Aphanomyces euteiches]KAH9166863.1 hypothetical protein AeNC1_018240 [Aphanomyces euteiches]